jgi:hypothetical protein
MNGGWGRRSVIKHTLVMSAPNHDQSGNSSTTGGFSTTSVRPGPEVYVCLFVRPLVIHHSLLSPARPTPISINPDPPLPHTSGELRHAHYVLISHLWWVHILIYSCLPHAPWVMNEWPTVALICAQGLFIQSLSLKLPKILRSDMKNNLLKTMVKVLVQVFLSGIERYKLKAYVSQTQLGYIFGLLGILQLYSRG